MKPTIAQMRDRERRRKPLTGRWAEGICGMLRGRFFCISQFERHGAQWVSVANRKGGRCVGVYPAFKFRPVGR